MKGIWWRGFKLWEARDGRLGKKKHWTEWQFMPAWTLSDLMRVRDHVAKTCAFAQEGNPDDFGFAPRTETMSAYGQLTDVPKLTNGFDQCNFSYAFYLEIQAADGTWDEGPPLKPKKLTSLVKAALR